MTKGRSFTDSGNEVDADDEMESDENTGQSKRREAPIVKENELEKTFVIFDADAYLRLYPYCRAILEHDRLKDCEDFESVCIFVPAAVATELEQVASRRDGPMCRLASDVRRMIRTAVRDCNPHLKKQAFDGLAETVSDTDTDDDDKNSDSHDENLDARTNSRRLQSCSPEAAASEATPEQTSIIKQAQLLHEHGVDVVVVTGDTYQQARITSLDLTLLDFVTFLARFHWLTPVVIKNLIVDMRALGEDATLTFAETVLSAVLWRAAVAHLAPMPMKECVQLFPSQDLQDVLTDLLKQESELTRRGEPFASLDYEHVTRLQTLLERRYEWEKPGGCLERSATFLAEAIVLCWPIGNFYVNTEAQINLLRSIYDVYKLLLSDEWRPILSKPAASSNET